MPRSMASVIFQQVTKRFGPVSVIEGLDLEVRDREFMVLVGPSGCGKSTALRMIAGLEEISDGNIQIGDRVVNWLPPKEREIVLNYLEATFPPRAPAGRGGWQNPFAPR